MKRRGFTIVELLIVIVIIAILAAITIVAYNGIQQRARVQQLWSGIRQVDKSMRLMEIARGLDEFEKDGVIDPSVSSNVSISSLISDTEFKNYMQQVPTMGTNWFYDFDGDDYANGQISSGVNLCIDIDSATASALDSAQDDGNISTGRIRYNGSRLYYSLSYTKSL